MDTQHSSAHPPAQPVDISQSGATDAAPGAGRFTNKVNKNLQCPNCGRSFNCSAHVRRHIVEVHLGIKRNAQGKKGKQREEERKKFKCKAQCSQCGKWYASKNSVCRHKRLHHRRDQMDTSRPTHSAAKTVGSLTGSDSATSSVTASVDTKPMYRCHDCGAAFTDEATLDKHEYSVHIHTKMRLWEGKKGDTIQNQDTKAKPKEEKSSIKNFLQKYSQIREQQKKRQRKRKQTYIAVNCKLCGKRFSSQGNLTRHLRRSCYHTMSSSECTRDELKYQEMKDSKLVRYKCDDCTETFCSEALRDKHEYSVHIQSKTQSSKKKDELINMQDREETSQYPHRDTTLLDEPSRQHEYKNDSKAGHNPVRRQKNGPAPKRRRKWLGVKCNFCGMQFFSKYGRNRHVKNSCMYKSSPPQCSLSELVCDEVRSRKSVSGDSSAETCTDDAIHPARHSGRAHNVNIAHLYKPTSHTKKVHFNSEKHNQDNHQQTHSSFRSPDQRQSSIGKKSLELSVSEYNNLKTQQKHYSLMNTSKNSSNLHFPNTERTRGNKDLSSTGKNVLIYNSDEEDVLSVECSSMIVVDNSGNYTNTFRVEDWTYTCPKCKEDIMGSFSFVMHIKAHMDRCRDS